MVSDAKRTGPSMDPAGAVFDTYGILRGPPGSRGTGPDLAERRQRPSQQLAPAIEPLHSRGNCASLRGGVRPAGLPRPNAPS